MRKHIKLLTILFISGVSILLLVLAIKGNSSNGSLTFQNDTSTVVEGPYESTNSTSRYALTESIVNNHAFSFTNNLAAFASPDLVQYNGRYFSIFTPGVSFLGVPFYIVGSLFGIPQIATYSLILLLALINFWLIAKIASKFGASIFMSLLSGFAFLFGTDAFPYALTFTQHHASVTLILLGFLMLFEKRMLIKAIVLGLCFGAALLMDIPNAFIMLPILIYALLQSVKVSETEKLARFSVDLKILGFGLGILPLLILFGYYNYALTGSFTKLGQTIGRVDYPSGTIKIKEATPIIKEPDSGGPRISISLPFDTRKQMSGLYTPLITDERGWLFYSPVLAIGILGLILAFRESKNKEYRGIIITAGSIAGITILMYSMFGDPWGGWSFGPRYLIPAAAIVSIGIGFAIQKFKNKLYILGLFFVIMLYIICVNILVGLTTNAIPPKVEALRLTTFIPHPY